MAVISTSIAVVVALLIGGALTRLGARWGVVDEPDGHLKAHVGSPVPLGGLAVFAGAHLGLAVNGLFDLGLLVATSLLCVVGLIDDLTGLSPVVRLVSSVSAGLVLVMISFQVNGLLEAMFWVVAVVFSVNAVNLFDGLDALAGSVATVTFLAMSWFALVQDSGEPVAGIILAGSVLGFLFWNRPPARLYLGDNGAYVVALLFVWLAHQASPDLGASVVAASLLGVPLLDLGVTVLRRYRSGAEIFAGDRDHAYDVLHQRGHPVARVTAVFVSLQVVWVAVVVLASHRFGDRAALSIVLLLGTLSVLWASHWVRRDREIGVSGEETSE